jgi:hypothetical protein
MPNNHKRYGRAPQRLRGRTVATDRRANSSRQQWEACFLHDTPNLPDLSGRFLLTPAFKLASVARQAGAVCGGSPSVQERGRTFDAAVVIRAESGDRCDHAAVAMEAAQRLRAALDRDRPCATAGLMILALRIARQPDGLWVAKGRRIDEPT